MKGKRNWTEIKLSPIELTTECLRALNNMGLLGELRAPSAAGRILGISLGLDQKTTGFLHA